MSVLDDTCPPAAASDPAPADGAPPPAAAKKRKKKPKKKRADDGPAAPVPPTDKAAADAAWAAGVDALTSADPTELWVRLAGAGVHDARARKVRNGFKGGGWRVFVCFVGVWAWKNKGRRQNARRVLIDFD